MFLLKKLLKKFRKTSQQIYVDPYADGEIYADPYEW